MNTSPSSPRSAGFTLIEIMVVIMILGLLATLVAQNVVNHVKTANETKARADVKTLADAAKWFFVHRGRVPKLDDLTARDDKNPPAIDELPRDPWDHDYELIEGTAPGDIVVVSAGPDGVLGSADDIRSRAAQ